MCVCVCVCVSSPIARCARFRSARRRWFPFPSRRGGTTSRGTSGGETRWGVVCWSALSLSLSLSLFLSFSSLKRAAKARKSKRKRGEKKRGRERARAERNRKRETGRYQTRRNKTSLSIIHRDDFLSAPSELGSTHSISFVPRSFGISSASRE